MNQENKQAMTRTSGNPLEKVTEFIPFGGQDKIKLSVSIVQNIVAVQTRSGKTCSENDAIKFIMLCSAQRLNPFAGDAYLVGYDSQHGASFSLITAHQAFLKRAESSEHYLGMESGIILLGEDGTITEREGDFHLKEEQVVGGWARVFHAKRPDHPTYRRIRMERFNNGFAQWKQDAAGMICKCAEADALRSTFPTLLGGMYVPGEIIDIKADVEAVRPMFSEQKRVEMVRAREPEGEREDDNSNEEIAPARGRRAASTQQPEKTHEPTKQPEGAQNARDGVRDALEAQGVTFDEFRGLLATEGDLKDADSFADWDSIPLATFDKFAKDAKKLAKCIRIYGKATK
jgi:phage recombination protein Bet